MSKRTIRALAFPSAPNLEPLLARGAPLLAPPPPSRPENDASTSASARSRGTILVALRREDKEVLDALQAWWHFRTGKRLPPERLVALLVRAALENPSAPFHGARFLALRRNT